ncbi:ribonuclease H-like protein [Eremomyces bilateralis CBS 781.70]|uniref:Ribonuclease H-like protein n=1 Tax=Eremomyces bilateralis CBS 781.70 TaxID=1392243 RepID=A0A6G1FX72_9PEZI|nr:ribonuclease H-like protein [Eremomyces bilateralis CBS 781.70]KAF1810266.1 ribonuclease H-like protein [Eremomyces bilateralis CBS 781.70]
MEHIADAWHLAVWIYSSGGDPLRLGFHLYIMNASRSTLSRTLHPSPSFRTPPSTRPIHSTHPIHSLSIPPLPTTHLRTLLHHLGAPTTGTKPTLLTNLRTALHLHRLSPTPRPTIVSIDLGLRNLGICVAQLDFPPASSSLSPSLTVTHWRRIELVPAVPSPSPTPSDSLQTTYLPPDPFAPSALASLARRVVDEWVRPHKPSAVLIERQRWRTGGAAAVQQWTVRVGLLEMGLWSVLGMGDGERREVVGVSPARVVGWWVGGEKGGKGGKGKGKREKSRRVEVVGRWVREGVGEGEGITVGFEGQAGEMARAFVELGKKGRRKKGEEEGIGKLDDLSDCLLQAAAFAKWEGNKRMMEGMTGEELRAWGAGEVPGR